MIDPNQTKQLKTYGKDYCKIHKHENMKIQKKFQIKLCDIISSLEVSRYVRRLSNRLRRSLEKHKKHLRTHLPSCLCFNKPSKQIVENENTGILCKSTQLN